MRASAAGIDLSAIDLSANGDPKLAALCLYLWLCFERGAWEEIRAAARQFCPAVGRDD